jgi:hypothetical protein
LQVVGAAVAAVVAVAVGLPAVGEPVALVLAELAQALSANTAPSASTRAKADSRGWPSGRWRRAKIRMIAPPAGRQALAANAAGQLSECDPEDAGVHSTSIQYQPFVSRGAVSHHTVRRNSSCPYDEHANTLATNSAVSIACLSIPILVSADRRNGALDNPGDADRAANETAAAPP